MDLKLEILKILTPIFGDEVKRIIDRNYDSSNPNEIINMAYHMLSEYSGEETAKRLLEGLTKRLSQESRREK